MRCFVGGVAIGGVRPCGRRWDCDAGAVLSPLLMEGLFSFVWVQCMYNKAFRPSPGTRQTEGISGVLYFLFFNPHV